MDRRHKFDSFRITEPVVPGGQVDKLDMMRRMLSIGSRIYKLRKTKETIEASLEFNDFKLKHYKALIVERQQMQQQQQEEQQEQQKQQQQEQHKAALGKKKK